MTKTDLQQILSSEGVKTSPLYLQVHWMCVDTNREQSSQHLQSLKSWLMYVLFVEMQIKYVNVID